MDFCEILSQKLQFLTWKNKIWQILSSNFAKKLEFLKHFDPKTANFFTEKQIFWQQNDFLLKFWPKNCKFWQKTKPLDKKMIFHWNVDLTTVKCCKKKNEFGRIILFS